VRPASTPADDAVGSQQQRALCADPHGLFEATVGVRQIAVGCDPVSFQGNSLTCPRDAGMGTSFSRFENINHADDCLRHVEYPLVLAHSRLPQ
jgi:hypothetical protein